MAFVGFFGFGEFLSLGSAFHKGSFLGDTCLLPVFVNRFGYFLRGFSEEKEDFRNKLKLNFKRCQSFLPVQFRPILRNICSFLVVLAHVFADWLVLAHA